MLVDDIQDFLNQADDQCWKWLRSIVINGKELGLILVAAGRSSDVKKLADMEPIVSKIIAGQNGLAVSGGASMYDYYMNNLSYEEKVTELKSSQGLLYHNGTTEKIKLVEE